MSLFLRFLCFLLFSILNYAFDFFSGDGLPEHTTPKENIILNDNYCNANATRLNSEKVSLLLFH
jgi:hypothetical protein